MVCRGKMMAASPSCFLLLAVTAVHGYVVPPVVTPGPPRECCWGDDTLQHGEVALSLPRLCLQLVCNNGTVERRYLNDDNTQKHCCQFGEQMYPEGEELPGQCVGLVCRRGCWHPTGIFDDCCNHCVMHDDIHAYTFDGHQYDFHGVCNYSLAQTGFSQTPEIGVFSDFDTCFGTGSCLEHVTYQNDPHTVITILRGALFDINVNGDPYHVVPGKVQTVRSSGGCHPVLAWRSPIAFPYPHCLMLLGDSRITIQMCPHRLDVWAHPVHMDGLDGLCGHFNFYVADDFTDRAGVGHPLSSLPSAFLESWKTNMQGDYHCNDDTRRHLYPHETPLTNISTTVESALYQIPQTDQSCPEERRYSEAWITYMDQCRAALAPVLADTGLLDPYTLTCASDLCKIYDYAPGKADYNVKFWLYELKRVALVGANIQNGTCTI